MTSRPAWVQEILDKELERCEKNPPIEPAKTNSLTLKRARDAKILEDHVSPRILPHVLHRTIETTDATRACRRWLQGDASFLVLSGGVGVGKTVAAISAFYKPGVTVAKNGHPSAFRILRASDLAQTIDPWQNEDVRKESPVWPRLVIDDLGTEFADNRRFRAALEKTIDLRMNRPHLRTIVTTNLPREAIREMYGDRVADRLNDCGVFMAITGASRRRKGKL